MPQPIPLFYAPDIDNAWSVAPGALTSINALAPLQGGAYGSMGTANYLGSSLLTGDDIYSAHALRQIGGTVRLFVTRDTNIDEYDNAGTRTNRATGLTSSTAGWSMCAQGNAIVACNISNATQVSTGAGFAALGGGSPKAVHCASNFGFIMLANTDTNQDQVWWSAIYNYASFTPSIATEAGNVRLLEAPGPITALIAYRDGFVAFKDNALFVGEYVGPNYIWRWRCLSHRVGCVGGKAVAELDGKLYFLHTSGFYEFDGQNLRNVGSPINQTFLAGYGYASGIASNLTTLDTVNDSLSNTGAAADDIEGVVWFMVGTGHTGSTGFTMWGYNPRCGKWGKHSLGGINNNTVTARYPRMVAATTADMQSFKTDLTGRVWMIWNVQGSASNIRSIRYAVTNTDSTNSAFTTGLIGSKDGSLTLKRMYYRLLRGTDSGVVFTGGDNGYADESGALQTSNVVGATNTELNAMDLTSSSRFHVVTTSLAVTGGSSFGKFIIGGAVPEFEIVKR